MDRFKNILVALSLTEMDNPIIQYASIISRMANLESIHHVHVNRSLHIPDKIREKYPQLQPLKEYSESTMQQKSIEHFENKEFDNLHFKAVEGNPLKELLSDIANKDIDLVLIGRKADIKGTRMLPVKIARKAPCSVLVVPEDVKPSIKKILVPIDFSENSLRAVDVALAFASSKPNLSIQFLHVYQLPIGYSKTGKTDIQFGEIMKSNAIKSYIEFIKKIDLKDVPNAVEFVLDDKPAKAIKRAIESDKIDLIVLGARGMSENAGILLGSVTENLLLTTNVPLIAVKKKGEGLKFLEALFRYI